MWDATPDQAPDNLARDLPCAHCGHAVHTFLACSDTCGCPPCVMPGGRALARG
jgi:hypothetical protein